MNRDRLISSLKTLEHFTNDSLCLKHHSTNLSEFHYNRDLLRAAVANTYVETVGNRSDSLYLGIENSSPSSIKNSLFSRISAISKHSGIGKERYIIAFDYTTEDFYGEVNDRWIHGWTGENGVTGKYSYLTASIVNKEMKLPIISIPSPAGNIMPAEVMSILETIKTVVPSIDLLLFDRGFYSKDLIVRLSSLPVPYLIFVPKREMERRELESMKFGEKKVMVYEFSFYSDNKKIKGDTKLAFLRKIFDRRSSEYYDWVFATNMEELNLDSIIAQYKIRWRIETMFRVQDESRIKTKSKMIEVRYFLFAYEQLIEAIWYLFYNKEVSFKRFLIELSDACTTMVDNEERKERNRRQE
ncbi:MAG: transposase [Thermoplasmatales archaeon]|nr:transposase [Thermoplasmatales archaeon]